MAVQSKALSILINVGAAGACILVGLHLHVDRDHKLVWGRHGTKGDLLENFETWEVLICCYTTTDIVSSATDVALLMDEVRAEECFDNGKAKDGKGKGGKGKVKDGKCKGKAGGARPHRRGDCRNRPG